jgi:hypothetical protein
MAAHESENQEVSTVGVRVLRRCFQVSFSRYMQTSLSFIALLTHLD